MSPARQAAYGARPVSMDLTRGRSLAMSSAVDGNASPAVTSHAPVLDQLALAHWPTGHAVVVCGLAGGTGRTTLASLVAAALAELPWAHVHKPVALVELRPRQLSTTRRRWLAESAGEDRRSPRPADQYCPPSTRSGIELPGALSPVANRRRYSVVVAEAPVGLPSEHWIVNADPSASVLLVVRPDRRSLAEAADSLVWMHDQDLVRRGRVVVVVNLGAGQADRGSRAASTALAVRCRAVHRLASDTRLGPLACLPSGTALAPSLRRPISALCLDLWRTSQQSTSHRECDSEETP